MKNWLHLLNKVTRAPSLAAQIMSLRMIPRASLRRLAQLILFTAIAGVSGVGVGPAHAAIFNVQDYGAAGLRADDARPAIQKAIEACAASGGGTVLIPRGEYTSGTLHLRSHVHLEIAAGATLFASTNEAAYDYGAIPSRAALLYGENLEDVAIGGEGMLDGQAAYEWRDDDVEHSFDHKDRMLAAGKSIRRSFPVGLPRRTVFPHLMFLSGCKAVAVTGLKWLRAPSWTITLCACERVRMRELYVHTSLKEGVWADGIDMDGCKDVRIERCKIETGDDCVVFISTDVWGPARTCENITVAECRLSSASAGVKFSEGNRAGVRNVVVRDCVLTNVNRGVVFYTLHSGGVSDVAISNLTIQCNRFDWFWAGDGQPFHFRSIRHSEWNRVPTPPGEPKPGVIRNVTVRNVVARGKGSSPVFGHAESWMDGISFEDVQLFLSADPAAPFDVATNALAFRCVKNLKLKNVSVTWDRPALREWKSALTFNDVADLEIDGFSGRQAWPNNDVPAVTFNHVTNASVTRATAPNGTGTFLKVGSNSRNILLQGNDLREASVPWVRDPNVPSDAVTARDNKLSE